MLGGTSNCGTSVSSVPKLCCNITRALSPSLSAQRASPPLLGMKPRQGPPKTATREGRCRRASSPPKAHRSATFPRAPRSSAAHCFRSGCGDLALLGESSSDPAHCRATPRRPAAWKSGAWARHSARAGLRAASSALEVMFWPAEAPKSAGSASAMPSTRPDTASTCNSCTAYVSVTRMDLGAPRHARPVELKSRCGPLATRRSSGSGRGGAGRTGMSIPKRTFDNSHTSPTIHTARSTLLPLRKVSHGSCPGGRPPGLASSPPADRCGWNVCEALTVFRPKASRRAAPCSASSPPNRVTCAGPSYSASS
mmetsp:Transcript_62726/g.198067  ORF Transcript_62726/g.198067 Transcript_62726/m.198067 type:complete len:310 (+) Transcript_62726:208-1137(+)